MKRAFAMLVSIATLAVGSCTSSSPEPIRVGAVYPLSGSQGPGGVEEFDGARLAVQLVNADGGVGGRPVELVPVDTPGSDAAPGAIARLDDDGVRLVLGSYGSTISEPAAEAAAARGMLFWETGAVGEMSGRGAGRLVFRVAPSGAVLGRNAMAFVADEYAPVLGVDPSNLRYAVTPRFSLSASEPMLDSCAELLAAADGVYVTSHINENGAEIDQVAGHFPARSHYLDTYHHHGLVTDRTVLAHNVHPTDHELEVMAEVGSWVAHCPTSNAALGSGLFPFRRHQAYGVGVALGSDVGAGTGLSYALLRDGVGDAGRVLAFEQSPEMFAHARTVGGRLVVAREVRDCRLVAPPTRRTRDLQNAFACAHVFPARNRPDD